MNTILYLRKYLETLQGFKMNKNNFLINLSEDFVIKMNERADYIQSQLSVKAIWENERWERYLRESRDSYILGQFVASIIMASCAVEICLADVLGNDKFGERLKGFKTKKGKLVYDPDSDTYFKLICGAKEANIIDDDLYGKLEKLRLFRTNYIHGIGKVTRKSLKPLNWRQINQISESSNSINIDYDENDVEINKDAKEIQGILSIFVTQSNTWEAEILPPVKEGSIRITSPINVTK